MKAASSSYRDLRRRLSASRVIASRKACIIAAGDTRELLPVVPDESVDCVVTSPPYGPLKNYGAARQVGYGQHMKREYFRDLASILRELYRVCKPGAALWIVLDTWRTSAGVTILLPMEVAALGLEAGFVLHDVVIWDKGKSLPWSHHGRFRGVCEYVLLLGKGRLRTFDLGAARDSDELASYWVRYPERYHPDGKAPSDLWHFPIPVQGSWGRNYSRHFCPFPPGLVARMIRLTTTPNDVVLDPFAGAGTVPAIASLLGRYGAGIELNPKFVRAFDKNGYDRLKVEARSKLALNAQMPSSLRNMIVDLRILKFARALYSALARGDRLNGMARPAIGGFVLQKVVRHVTGNDVIDTDNLGRITLLILLRSGAVRGRLEAAVRSLLVVRPLTKYGFKVDVKIVSFREWKRSSFIKRLPKGKWYVYRRGQFFKFDTTVTWSRLGELFGSESNDLRQKIPSIISQIEVSLEVPVPDYA